MKNPTLLSSAIGSRLAIVSVLLLACGFSSRSLLEEASPFDAERAFEDVEKLVALGPRPVGSEGHRTAVRYLLEELQATGLEVERQDFTGQTPLGPIPMSNLIAIHRGGSDQMIMFAGHYDTKRFDEISFVGANDGGSSAAVILELARAVSHIEPPPAVTIWFVLFDGEEALVSWSATDSLYGSRQLVFRMGRDGQLDRLRAFILVDMVGDRDLGILREWYSTRWLQDLVWNEAKRLGYGEHFLDSGYPVDDDHVPFADKRVPALDLIDLDYGPHNRYWHSSEDTLDKLSAKSLGVVGETLLAVLARLEDRITR
jgi:hypothetical protein